jgi:type IV secretion system protein VirD4
MIVDPNGHGLHDRWSKTASALLIGTILQVLHMEPNKTLRGVAGALSDPQFTVPQTLERLFSTQHDPNRAMNWRNYHGEPTSTHPIVAETVRGLLNKSENERSGVLLTAMSFLSIYGDPIIAANTERSKFKITDLMNHERPISLFWSSPSPAAIGLDR